VLNLRIKNLLLKNLLLENLDPALPVPYMCAVTVSTTSLERTQG